MEVQAQFGPSTALCSVPSAGFARAIRLPGGGSEGGRSPPPKLPRLGDLLPVSIARVEDLFDGGLLHCHRDLLAALAQHLSPGVVAEPRTGRNEPAHDDVLLQTAQVVGL